MRPYLFNMLLLGPNWPCLFHIVKNRGVSTRYACRMSGQPTKPHVHGPRVLCLQLVFVLPARSRHFGDCLAISHGRARCFILFTLFYFIYQPTLVCIGQCPSNNISNRYGLTRQLNCLFLICQSLASLSTHHSADHCCNACLSSTLWAVHLALFLSFLRHSSPCLAVSEAWWAHSLSHLLWSYLYISAFWLVQRRWKVDNLQNS